MAGGAPLVFLPGALGELEGGGEVLRRLAASRPLIRIAYRAEDRLDALLDRIAGAAGAERFDLLGQSYGGWIAQCVARQFPGRVRRMVLSHSFILRPRDAWRFRLGMKLLRAMPTALLRPLLLKRVRRAVAPLARTDPGRADRQLAALAAELSGPGLRATLEAQQRCMLDSLLAPFATLAPVAAGVAVLIIESDDDPLLGPRARGALRERYPDSEVHLFRGAGHISAMVESDAYAARVARFLES